MDQPITSEHQLDANGNPAGGTTTGTGLTIAWQDGPLQVDGTRREPTGAFVEGVIKAAIDRLEFYQASRFACLENGQAITNLKLALGWLHQRTTDRTARGVEGTHQA